MTPVPSHVNNWIDGQERPARSGLWFDKVRPADGGLLCRVARSGQADIEQAVTAARAAQRAWADTTAVVRGNLVRDIALRMRDRRLEISELVAQETGKSLKLALGETDAAIEMGLFIAGEGRRYYGRTTTASMAHRSVSVVRQPVGIAGLIISFNTPMPNVAWKAFPAIFCGNAAILKPSEETPLSAWIFGQICWDAGLPPGVLNIVQGLGSEAGAALVASPDVKLVSFTGSCETGRQIQKACAERLAKVCMELGGKNALVVCDDADLDNALNWVLQSAFSNAGQRCAAASRILVFDSIYPAFRDRLARAARELKVGSSDDDFMGPVISERQVQRLQAAVAKAVAEGARVVAGGERLTDAAHAGGFFMAPTVLENVAREAEISRCELFGPVAVLYRVSGFQEALELVNASPYGLTACIHTANLHRAMRFAEKVEAGVVVVNAGTHGSEPHMGFGGVKDSGTGWREAGVEALEVYSELKYINVVHDPGKV
jgi:aldehyde dehydrogenase (NAD+)